MANKPYLTLKKMNEILSLYGVMISRERLFAFTGNDRHVIHKVGTVPYSWGTQTEHVFGNTNQERLEDALTKIDRLK